MTKTETGGACEKPDAPQPDAALSPDGTKWQGHSTFCGRALSGTSVLSCSFTKRGFSESLNITCPVMPWLQTRSPSDACSGPQDIAQPHVSSFAHWLADVQINYFPKGFFASPPAVVSKGSNSSLVTLCACVSPMIINGHTERLAEARSTPWGTYWL